MATINPENAEAFSADAYPTQRSGKRWEPPAIHKLSVTQSENGTNPTVYEILNTLTGGAVAPS